MIPVVVEDLTMLMPGPDTNGMLRLSVSSGASAEEAVTLLSSSPLPGTGEPLLSTSPCVTVFVAIQVNESPGSRELSGHDMAEVMLSSTSIIAVSVVFPSLVTR